MAAYVGADTYGIRIMLKRNVAPILDWRFIVAGLLATTLLHEAHELVHILTVPMACNGDFGGRSLAHWELAPGCHSAIPVFAAPIFTYLLSYIGAAMLFMKSPRMRSFGVGLIFAATPLCQGYAALKWGGGDEIWGFYEFTNAFTGENGLRNAQIFGCIFCLMFGLPSIVILAMKLKHRLFWLWVPIIGIGPVLFNLYFVHKVLIPIDNAISIAGPAIFGGSALLTLFFGSVMVAALFTYKWLGRVSDGEGEMWPFVLRLYKQAVPQ